MSTITGIQKNILADPQTSGGLLIAADPKAANEIEELFGKNSLENFVTPIGKLISKKEKLFYIQ